MSVFVVQGRSGHLRISRSVPTASQALSLRRQLLDEASNVEVLGMDGRSISVSDLQILADADAAKPPTSLPWVIDQDKRLAALAECRIMDTQPDYQFEQIDRRAAYCATHQSLS